MDVSFKGKVFLTGSSESFITRGEYKYLKNFAKKEDCDVVVLNRDYYSDNTGKLDAILVKTNEGTGQNHLFAKVFDFKNAQPSNTKTQEIDIFG